MGLFDGLMGRKKDNGAQLFQQQMVSMSRELVDGFLKARKLTFEQLEDLDRQVLMVYVFGLVAAINVEEERGFDPKVMGDVEIAVIQETFHQNKRMSMICAHDIVEQTKTRDVNNPIYGIICRGEQIFPTWHNGMMARVVQDMESVVQMMHDIQNNVAISTDGPRKDLPEFKYHPNLYKNGEVEFQSGVCQCCGKTVDAYVKKLYCDEDVNCICLDCVKSGAAVEKFGGEFSQDVDVLLPDEEATDELLHRTPGYDSWQGEHWLSCCGDYCAYLGKVGSEELEEMRIADQVCGEYEAREDSIDGVRDLLSEEGPVTGYLFQCTHCGAYHLWVDVQE